MFIKREIYELDLQNAYEDGNSDATKMWQKEFELQREYYQDKLIELRESIKTTKKDDIVKKINEILVGRYYDDDDNANKVKVKYKILLNGKEMWETMNKEKEND